MNNNKGSFVAVSDFHSTEYPLEKVKNYYINETAKKLREISTNSTNVLQELKKAEINGLYPILY